MSNQATTDITKDPDYILGYEESQIDFQRMLNNWSEREYIAIKKRYFDFIEAEQPTPFQIGYGIGFDELAQIELTNRMINEA